MPRKKLTEYKSKSILFSYLDTNYSGINLNDSNYNSILKNLTTKKYVVKVDQGVKKRFKLGLIGLNLESNQIENYIKDFIKKGYSNFLIEDFVEHKADSEGYLSFERVREGINILFSNSGGVDIESNQESIKSLLYKNEDSELRNFCDSIKLDFKFLKSILNCFNENYFSFLEINPLVRVNNKYVIMDLAVEADSAAVFFVKNWGNEDLIDENISQQKSQEEKEIELLASKSTASFRFNLLNKDGSIWMLLSGGGASIVIADEAYQRGHGDDLANYGEYSGNPNTQETYIYAKNALSLMLKSKAKKKTLIIAGGVANFTDVYKTFQGIIMALDEIKVELHKEKIKVFVRRGGPNEKKGLESLEKFLKENNLLGRVEGSDYVLTEIVNDAIKSIN